MSDPAPILHARGLTYAVPGRTLLEDAGLTLRRGERHVIIGRNGAGKSTLLKVLTGELTPRAGTIDVWGRSLASYRPREIARRRAVLPQHTALNFDYQVLEVALLGRLPHLGNRPETAADFALARGAAVLAILHDLNLAARYANAITLLAEGRIVASGPPAEVLTAPLLEAAFHHRVLVQRHPVHACPLIVPI